MKRKMYSIVKKLNKDETIAYPIIFENDDMAKLWFNTHMSTDLMMKQAPEAYALMRIGTWNSVTGEITQDPNDDRKIILEGGIKS